MKVKVRNITKEIRGAVENTDKIVIKKVNSKAKLTRNGRYGKHSGRYM